MAGGGSKSTVKKAEESGWTVGWDKRDEEPSWRMWRIAQEWESGTYLAGQGAVQFLSKAFTNKSNLADRLPNRVATLRAKD